MAERDAKLISKPIPDTPRGAHSYYSANAVAQYKSHTVTRDFFNSCT